MSFLSTFVWAATGIIVTLAHERNFKIHWVSCAAVMLVLSGLRWPVEIRLVLLGSCAAVLAAELINTAVETVVDAMTAERTAWAKRAKDAAAGGVLVLAVAAALLLSIVVADHWARVEAHADDVLRTVAFGLPLLLLMAVVLFVPAPRPLTWVLVLVQLGLGLALVPHSRDLLAWALLLALTVVSGGAASLQDRSAPNGA